MGYSFQKYTEYRNINDLAFDEIPVAWKLQKVKHLFKIGRGRVISQEELDDNGVFPVYSSQTQNNGCLGYIHTYDFDCKQITWTTDGANAGTVFLREGKHNCTNVCGTLKPIKSNLNYHFYLYLLQYVTQFHKRPDTNGAKIMNGEMASISLCIPSDTEQQKIANFLDHETTKIDTLIAKQEKLIELLKEKRQAVISHAVTKGISYKGQPNAPMKDSGVEWLGEVPEHWKISSLKYFASIQGGYAFNSNEFVDNGVQILRIGNVYQNRLALGRQPTFVNDTLYNQLPEFRVTKGDILMSLTGTLGKRDYGFAVKVDLDGHYLLNQRVAKLTPVSQKITRSFLLNVLWSESYLTQLYALPSGTKQANLSNSDVLRIVVAVPPSKEEQQEVALYVEEKLAKLDDLTKLATEAILLMKERKTALISAAVTGKIDVRNWKGDC
ncbi:restriction endonuclease subunit S [Shewanella sp. SM95]|uniref:restriction endonuclease subunit S n=1 Tax=Shewanella TaxID=22 RepID=UPI0021D8DF88|nr:restriction endonuclease subunit S [Shewanella sp. SM95]MCU7997285.1 restriction endonuclease subunit S [Shewanella sp. SM95]